VLGHRILLTAEAHVSGRSTTDVITRIVRGTTVPAAVSG
jgi:hypothetical protein